MSKPSSWSSLQRSDEEVTGHSKNSYLQHSNDANVIGIISFHCDLYNAVKWCWIWTHSISRKKQLLLPFLVVLMGFLPTRCFTFEVRSFKFSSKLCIKIFILTHFSQCCMSYRNQPLGFPFEWNDWFLYKMKL